MSQDQAGDRVFQMLAVSVRTEKPDPKTGKARTVVVAHIKCHPSRCTKKNHECRLCIAEAKVRGAPALDKFLTMEKFNNAGAHHLLGDYQVPELA